MIGDGCATTTAPSARRERSGHQQAANAVATPTVALGAALRRSPQRKNRRGASSIGLVADSATTLQGSIVSIFIVRTNHLTNYLVKYTASTREPVGNIKNLTIFKSSFLNIPLPPATFLSEEIGPSLQQRGQHDSPCVPLTLHNFRVIRVSRATTRTQAATLERGDDSLLLSIIITGTTSSFFSWRNCLNCPRTQVIGLASIPAVTQSKIT